MKKGIIKILTFPIFMSTFSSSSLAFDNDFEFAFPNFRGENFLDIQSFQLRQAHQDQWLEADNAWRVIGGSLNLHQLYSQVEFKTRKPVGTFGEVRLNAWQRQFYTTKPSVVQFEMGVKPTDFTYLSVFGTPTYEKRDGDIGIAVELGNRANSYLRLAQLEQDHFFNQKNDLDSRRYSIMPKQYQLEGKHLIKTPFNRSDYIYGRWENERTFSLFNPDTNQSFQFNGADWQIKGKKWFDEKQSATLEAREFSNFKSQISAFIEQQEINYQSLGLGWHLLLKNGDELSLGIRHDDFSSLYQNLGNLDTHNIKFSTAQVSALLIQQQSSFTSYQYGLYIGDSNLQEEFVNLDISNDSANDIEAKFRFAFEWTIEDLSAVLVVATAWNIDHMEDQVGDGWNINMQSVF